MNKIIWKDIEGFDGMYKISSNGSVFSVKSNKTLKNQIHGSGYMAVNLSKNGRITQRYIHSLVAEAFIDNPLRYTEVNHKDEDKTNNCVDNLEWCTRKYNCNYGKRNVKMMMNRKLKTVYAYDVNGNYIGVFGCASECAKSLRISESCVSKCLIGKNSSSHGYIFLYEDNRDELNRRMKLLRQARKVVQIKDNEVVKEWKSLKNIYEVTGYNYGHISEVCRGERNSAYGCQWKYI